MGDELVEISVSEQLARALAAVAQGDILQRAGLHVAGEGFDRTVELGGSLRRCQQSTRHRQS
jgi:hypothetical protein